MSRTSHDIYKLPSGELVPVSCDQAPPENSTLWNGYDYDKQEWFYQGQKDTRTIEQILKDARECLAPKRSVSYVFKGTVEELRADLIPAFQR